MADNQLAVVEPKRDEHNVILNRLGLTDDGRNLAPQIRDYIKNVMQLKGADARAEYYRILKNDMAPAIAASVDRAASEGWLKEIRYGKPNAEGEVTRFTVTHFKPIAPKVKKLTLTQAEVIRKSVGEDSQLWKDLVSKNLIPTPKTREVASEAVQS